VNLRRISIGVVATLALTPVACKRRDRPLPPQTAAPAPGTSMPAAPVPSAGNMDYQRRIATAQQVVAQDPKNLQAWIELGNDYFDTQQRQKAVDAYARALELKPKDPGVVANVLTDQGVMYRELGAFDKAIANFQKANQADPKHVQSLFNLGVVYLNDLKQPKKAIEAWNKVIQTAPQSEQASQARNAIEDAKKALPSGG
jgi:cytochrome c-type biogenesis protein CcmH/NrfG